MRPDNFSLINNGQRQIPIKLIVQYRYIDVPSTLATISLYGTKVGADPVVVVSNFVLRNTTKTYLGYAWCTAEIGLMLDKDVVGIRYELLSKDVELDEVSLVYTQASLVGGISTKSDGEVPEASNGYRLTVVIEQKDLYVTDESFAYTVSRTSTVAMTANLLVNGTKVSTIEFANGELSKVLPYTRSVAGVCEIRVTAFNHFDGFDSVDVVVPPQTIYIQSVSPAMRAGDYWIETYLPYLPKPVVTVANGLITVVSANPVYYTYGAIADLGTPTIASSLYVNPIVEANGFYRFKAIDSNNIHSYSEDVVVTIGVLGLSLEQPSMIFTTGGNAEWFVESGTTIVPGSTSYARSGVIRNSQQSWIQTVIPYSGVSRKISFYWKVSSNSSYDYLRMYVNDVQAYYINRTYADWVLIEHTLPDVECIIKWSYINDSWGSYKPNAGYLDKITITNL